MVIIKRAILLLLLLQLLHALLSPYPFLYSLPFVDPDPFTHVKKAAQGGDDIDMNFLKELEAEDAAAAKAASSKQKK